MAVRLAALLIIGIGALVAVLIMRSPMTIHEDEVRAMITSGELIGLPIEEAASRLQHRPPQPPVLDGIIVLDFAHVRGWRASAVELELQGGRVIAARWSGTQ